MLDAYNFHAKNKPPKTVTHNFHARNPTVLMLLASIVGVTGLGGLWAWQHFFDQSIGIDSIDGYWRPIHFSLTTNTFQLNYNTFQLKIHFS